MFAGENRAVALGEMLDARERRAAAQREMIERHGLPLVSFTLNVPGPVKDSALLRRAFDEGLRQIGAVLLAEQIETVQRAETRAATGCEALLAVRDRGEMRDRTVFRHRRYRYGRRENQPCRGGGARAALFSVRETGGGMRPQSDAQRSGAANACVFGAGRLFGRPLRRSDRRTSRACAAV